MKKLIMVMTIVILTGLPTLSSASDIGKNYSHMWGAIDIRPQMSKTPSGHLTQDALLGSELIGRSLYNRGNNQIGTVKDVVIGVDRQANYLIVEYAETSRSNVRLVPMPVFKFSRNFENDSTLKIIVSDEEIAQAPSFSIKD